MLYAHLLNAYGLTTSEVVYSSGGALTLEQLLITKRLVNIVQSGPQTSLT